MESLYKEQSERMNLNTVGLEVFVVLEVNTHSVEQRDDKDNRWTCQYVERKRLVKSADKTGGGGGGGGPGSRVMGGRKSLLNTHTSNSSREVSLKKTDGFVTANTDVKTVTALLTANEPVCICSHTENTAYS